jgi:hypothetical protein
MGDSAVDAKEMGPLPLEQSDLSIREDMIEFRGDGDFVGSRRGERGSPVVAFREPRGSRMAQESY